LLLKACNKSREEKLALTNTLKKLMARGLKTRVQNEMQEVEKQLMETNKRTDQVAGGIRDLKASVNNIQGKNKDMHGPMSKMPRTVLRKLGIELTVYCRKIENP